jgi:hypothetical protein
MEDDNIHVVEPDGSDDSSELLDLVDRWKIPVAVALGLLVVVVFVVSSQRGTEAPPGNSPEAAPVVSTTQPTVSTTSIQATTTSQTTTTLWLGAGTLLVSARAFCRDINPPGVRTSDEWADSVSIDDGTGRFLAVFDLYSYGIAPEIARVRNEQDIQLVANLDSILADLREAMESVDNALVALSDEAPDRWKHQVDLAERQCAQAVVTLERIVSMLYAE